jgi:NADPH2 dehydrogenase
MIDLVTPLEVKGLTLKNRLVMPPMQTSLATTKGEVTEKLIDYYVQRAQAVGLVIVEHSYISLEGKFSEKQLGIYNDHLISGLEQLVSQIKATGTPVVIQINHAGRTTSQATTGMTPISPSATDTAHALDITEVPDLANKYVSASDRAMKAGFDGVEVHGAHGFLLNQFYSPLVNHRTDVYGGNLENRIRFPLEVVDKVRKRIGNRLLLYRLGATDRDVAGVQLRDTTRFASQLEAAGVDIIDISGGLCGSRPAALEATPGFFIPQAQAVKKVVNIPVIGVGGIREADHANRLLKEEAVDLIAVGRPILNDASWALNFLQAVKG